jgi:hypothetical protein
LEEFISIQQAIILGVRGAQSNQQEQQM